jgi:hypothetical protein
MEELLETMFSKQSVLRLYKDFDFDFTAVQLRVGVSLGQLISE